MSYSPSRFPERIYIVLSGKLSTEEGEIWNSPGLFHLISELILIIMMIECQGIHLLEWKITGVEKVLLISGSYVLVWFTVILLQVKNHPEYTVKTDILRTRQKTMEFTLINK